MAFVGYQENMPDNGVITSSQQTMQTLTDPGALKSFSASFENNGSIKPFVSQRDLGNQARSALGLAIERDKDWDPGEAIKGLGPAYDHYYTQLLNTQNQSDFNALVRDIDSQHARDAILSSAGKAGVASLSGMLADPINLIPVGAPVEILGTMGKAARAASMMSVGERTANLFGKISAVDRDAAIRTIWGEARNQGTEGMAAVANVILNRAEKGTYGKSLTDIVKAPHQFEPWGNPTTRAAMQSLDPSSPEYQKIASVFDQVASGKLPDITKGADMFYSPKAQAALGREAPSWAKNSSPLATVGDHVFYASGGNPVDAAKRTARHAGIATAVSSGAASGLDVFGQYMANPDYSSKDAVMTLGMGALLGLGGGALAHTIGELRAQKLALAQKDFTGMMRNKLNSLKGHGEDPDVKSFNGIMGAIAKAGRPLSHWGEHLGDPEDVLDLSPKSVGAAAVASTDPIEIYRVGNVARYFRRLNPILDTLAGGSNSAKRIMSNLYDHNLLTTSDLKGEPLAPGGSVYSRVRVEMGRLADFQTQMDDLYRAFQKQQLNQKAEPMSRAEFEREVWRGTWNANRTDNVFVKKGVNAFRKQITQKSLKDAQEVGLLKGGAGEDYSPVIYNRITIRNDTQGFADAVRRATIEGYNNFKAKYPGKAAKLEFNPNKDTDALNRFVGEYTQFWAHNTDQTIEDMADAGTGRLRKRTYMPLQYNLLENYMENEASEVAARYMRAITPDIELMRKFGSVDLNNEIQMVKNEYGDLIKDANSEAAKNALAAERDRILKNLDFSVKAIRNRDPYSMMTSEGVRTAIKAIGLWTFSRAMGKFAINAVAESSMPLLVHGFDRTYGVLMKDFHNNFANLKLARTQALRAGIAVDKALSDRMTSFIDGANTATTQAGLERNIDRMFGGAAKLFGMPLINDTFRSIGVLYGNAMFGEDIPILAQLGKTGAKPTQKMIREYANLGIGQNEARMIAMEMEKHGEWVDNGNFFTPNTDKWHDEAARLYNGALMKSVDNVFLIPQAGDMPKFAQTPWGKPLFFLRSYTFAATHRLALAGVQRANKDMAQGVAGVLAMGMLSNALYQAASGRPQPEGLNVVYGALDRAGVLGMFWEANNLADRTVGVGLGNGDQMKNFSNPIVQLGGANAFTLADTADFIEHPSMDSAFKLMPGSNWLPMEAAKRSLIQ